jgi:hypothetical protein
MKNVLYIGSGRSALGALDEKYNGYIKVAVNNAWRIFKDTHFDIWIHSGDFPKESFPTVKNYDIEVGYTLYSKSAKKASEYFKWVTDSPQHYAGYTIFFMGLYYILMEMSPNEIGLLGFDHDYNPEKVEKWNSDNRPNLQNKFNNKLEPTIEEWSNNYFKGMEEDFFYGHGTPDPMRLGKHYLIEKFKRSQNSANELNIEIFNYSNVSSDINIFPFKQI